MNKIKKIRLMLKLNQEEMAKIMGTKQQAISVLENKERVGKGTEAHITSIQLLADNHLIVELMDIMQVKREQK